LAVLGEYKNKDGVLKSRWEIVRPENDGKHYAPGLQKTSYYIKDGVETRGFAQALSLYDLNFVRDNWSKIREALDPVPGSSPAAAAQAAAPEAIAEEPF
jgi:hypothetical protein